MNTKATPIESFDEISAAHAKVKATISALRTDHDGVCDEIAKVEAELRALPMAPVPVEDLKTAILEFIDASGQRYQKKVRQTITSFATGMMGAGQDVGHIIKQPLRFMDIEAAIANRNSSSGRAQLVNGSGDGFDDGALYCLFGDMVKAGLRRIMDDMTPEEFGYGTIRANEIGSGIADRRKAIEATAAYLTELKARRNDIAAKLRVLGYTITPTLKN